MTKSVYEFWLTQGKEKLRLPVLPEQLDVSNNLANESVKVSKFGEVTFINEPGAKTISFSSHFPKKYSPLAEYKGFLSPENAILKIEKWMKAKKPVQFLVTGTKINFTCSIENFSHREGEKDIGDRDFDLTLKEYQTASPRKIKQKRKRRKNGRPNRLQNVHRQKRRYALVHRRPFLRKQPGMAENLEREQTGDDQTKQAKHQTAGALDFPGQKLKIP